MDKSLMRWTDQTPDFPTICACWVCGGVKAAIRYGTVPDATGYLGMETLGRDDAYAMALLQHGYYIAKWEGQNVLNRTLIPTKCTCVCDHANTTERSAGHMLHEWTCPGCGATSVFDSSD